MNFRALLLVLPTVYGVTCSYAANSESYDSDTAKAIEVSAKAQEEAGATANSDNTTPTNSTSYVSSSGGGSVSSITGFYGGLGVGLDTLKNKYSNSIYFTNAGSDTTKQAASKAKKKKTGFNGDVYTGYNFQIGRFIFGLECMMDMNTAKTKATLGSDNTKQGANTRCKYSFGLAPRFGYAICGGLNGYVSLGTNLAKYAVNSKNENSSGTPTGSNQSSNPTKTSLFAGVGVEQSIGPMFIRGECTKTFKKSIATDNGTKINSESLTFRMGAGYRF